MAFCSVSDRFLTIPFHLWLLWLQTFVVIDCISSQRLFPSFSTMTKKDGVQQPVFVTPALLLIVITWFYLVMCLPVTAACQVKLKNCACSITLNVGPLSWFKYGFWLSVYAAPSFSCSKLLTWSSYWHLWFCTAAHWSSIDISNQMTAWKNYYHFSLYSIFPRQGTSLETDLCTGTVREGSSNTRLDYEYFGSLPLCPIFFYCTDHVQYSSYWLPEYQG